MVAAETGHETWRLGWADQTRAIRLMHLAHRTLWTGLPRSITTTRWRLGRKVRRVARIEKLRLCPKVVVLPQFAHFAIEIESFPAE